MPRIYVNNYTLYDNNLGLPPWYTQSASEGCSWVAWGILRALAIFLAIG